MLLSKEMLVRLLYSLQLLRISLGLLIQVHPIIRLRTQINYNFFFSSPKSIISTANGSTSPISGEGSVILSNTLTLDTVLVVPSLAYNLLSVGQITSTLNCTVTFWPLFCVFQDILTRKILGYGVRRCNLYYLELTENGGMKFSQANQTSSKETTQQTIWLWHWRLGHLSFGYLRKLKPHYFFCCERFSLPV